jgi:hypothetical protein
MQYNLYENKSKKLKLLFSDILQKVLITLTMIIEYSIEPGETCFGQEAEDK